MTDWLSSSSSDSVTGVIVVKVSIDRVASEEVAGYMDVVKKAVVDPRLQKQGYAYYFIPVVDAPTSMTFIDLATMASVTV